MEHDRDETVSDSHGEEEYQKLEEVKTKQKSIKSRGIGRPTQAFYY